MNRGLIMAALTMALIGCSAATVPPASPAVTTAPSVSASAPPSPSSGPSLTAAPSALPTASPSAAATHAGSPGPSQPATAVDPCTLLDPVTDLAALGGLTGEPRPASPTDWGPQCDYPTPAGSVLVVAFRPDVSDAVFEYSTAKVEISALGDTAFYDTDWDRVRVRVGATRFQVSCFCFLPSGTEQATLVQVAGSAAAHLVSP